MHVISPGSEGVNDSLYQWLLLLNHINLRLLWNPEWEFLPNKSISWKILKKLIRVLEMLFGVDFDSNFCTPTWWVFYRPNWEKSVIINKCFDTFIRDSRVVYRKRWQIVVKRKKKLFVDRDTNNWEHSFRIKYFLSTLTFMK